MSFFRNINIRISNIMWKLLLLFVFTIPLSQMVSIKMIIIVLILSFFIKPTQNFFSHYFYHSWDALLYILVLIIGLFYSANMMEGLKVIETSLSLIAMPLIFVKLKNFNREKTHKIISVFCLGLFVACIICIINSGIAYIKEGDWTVFFFHELINPLEFQPTYYAYYLIFVITCVLYALYYEVTTIAQPILISLVFFFFFFLLLIGGWTAMVSLFFLFSFFILKYSLEKHTPAKSITTIIISIMMVSLLILYTVVDLDTDIMLMNDYWHRTILWKAAVQANTSVLFGVGTGDSHYILNTYYHIHGMEKFEHYSYNAHNQFIQTYFSHGIMGIITVSFLLGRMLYLSDKHGRVIIALVCFPFLVYSTTEVFLNRYQGVVFFALVQQIFLTVLYSNKFFVSLNKIK